MYNLKQLNLGAIKGFRRHLIFDYGDTSMNPPAAWQVVFTLPGIGQQTVYNSSQSVCQSIASELTALGYAATASASDFLIVPIPSSSMLNLAIDYGLKEIKPLQTGWSWLPPANSPMPSAQELLVKIADKLGIQ